MKQEIVVPENIHMFLKSISKNILSYVCQRDVIKMCMASYQMKSSAKTIMNSQQIPNVFCCVNFPLYSIHDSINNLKDHVTSCDL